jgi:hypothetical protein
MPTFDHPQRLEHLIQEANQHRALASIRTRDLSDLKNAYQTLLQVTTRWTLGITTSNSKPHNAKGAA